MSSVIRKVIFGKDIGLKAVNVTSAFLFTRNNSQFIIQSDVPDVEIPKVSVDEYVFTNINKWPSLIATECGMTGRRYTYEEIQKKSINLSRALRKKLGLQKGDVLAVLLPNCPEFVLAAVGSLKAGLIVTTLNPIYTPDEISRQLNDSKAKAIVTLADIYQLAKASVDKAKIKIPILTVKTKPGDPTPEGAINIEEFTENIDFTDLPPSSPDEIAFLPYSSGTTGMPKGVQLTHSNIVSNLCQFNAKQIAVVQETTKDHQDILPAVLPKFHIYGLVATTLHLLYKGCRTVSLPKFTPEIYVNTLRQYKPDVLFVAPPIILFLAGHPSVKTADLQSIRSVVSGAAPLGGLDEQRFLEKAQKNIRVDQGYGLTETSPVVTMTRADLKEKFNAQGSIGRPVPQTLVKLVDPNDPAGIPLGPNKLGEMLVKGPQVMKGYHNKPKETLEIFTEDGWMRTGDMMYYNDDELFFVCDRLKELIKVKGFQVPPAELEEIIRDYPDVQDAAVIGIPHPSDGEVPRAFIVQKPGKKIDTKKLDEFVAEKVAKYKRLKGGIEVVETIPKNASGKIMRRTLKQMYEQKQ